MTKCVGIGMLWVGLAQFIEQHQIDYLFGCASVSMRDRGGSSHSDYAYSERRSLP